MAGTDVMAPPLKSNPSNELQRRLLSALFLIPPVMAAIYFGSPYFDILMAVGAVFLAVEWVKLCQYKKLWMGVGLFYITLPILSLVYIRLEDSAGFMAVAWLFVLVWSADSGAYFFGRLIGGPKFAPRISPKKTWAGFFGGVMMAALIGWIVGYYLDNNAVLNIQLITVSAVVGAISQFGDLLESAIKRHFNVKDSGTLIPGHGGLLDRVDGLLAAALCVGLINLYRNESILRWM